MVNEMTAQHTSFTTTYSIADQQRMSQAKNYFAWQARLVTRELGSRVVEVGCGIGNFTRHLLDRDLLVAVDESPDCIALLRQRYPDHSNLHALVTNLNDAAFSHLGHLQLDSCTCINVFEHIEDDLAALNKVASILVRGARIVLFVPAFPSLYGRIDKNLGHSRRYRRARIASLARRANLRIRKLHYFNFGGFFAWWANARLFHRESQSAAQIRFFDEFIVPVESRLERLVTPPFGQSLLAVLEKP